MTKTYNSASGSGLAKAQGTVQVEDEESTPTSGVVASLSSLSNDGDTASRVRAFYDEKTYDCDASTMVDTIVEEKTSSTVTTSDWSDDVCADSGPPTTLALSELGSIATAKSAETLATSFSKTRGENSLNVVDEESIPLIRPINSNSEVSILRTTRRNSQRLENVLAELTLNKLDTKSLGLIGRDEELSMLKACFQRLSTSTNTDSIIQQRSPNELVLISGYSGIGKSTLASALKESVQSSGGLYTEGKYEFTSTDEPYSGLAAAFGALCAFLERSSFVDSITEKIAENMGEEVAMLLALMPEFGSICPNDDTLTASSHTQYAVTGNEHDQLKQAFRTLTRVIGSYYSSIVIMLDDLQWADIASLDILDSLVSDVQSPNALMVLGCYRSNEVDENSILYNRMQTLRSKQERFNFRITDIELLNFDLGSTHTMIMKMLSYDNVEKTRDLAAVCFKRTMGNPFFLIEFMKMLDRKELLEFNLGTMQWRWDVGKIEESTMSTANVVDLVQARMRKLPSDIQLLLQYAACLGSLLSLSTLEYLWKFHALLMSETTSADLTGMLKILVEEKLVELCGNHELRWAHDKVQEAAFSLSDLVSPSFQFGLGVCLFGGLDEATLERQLFDVADLINKGNAIGRYDLARLNLRAAKKARKVAALQSAARYVAHGIKQLPADAWTTEREVVLQLYSLGAEIEFVTGNISLAEEYVEVVLEQKECTAMEKMELRMTKAQILATARLHYDESINYGLAALKGIGYKAAWSRKLVPVQALALISKTVKRLQKLPITHFEGMPLMKNRQHRVIIAMLGKLQQAAYHADIFLNFVCICKMIELTLDHGLHEYSASKFSGLAGIVMFLKNDHVTASHFCDIAFSIQERFGGRGVGETLYVAAHFTFVQTKPLHEVLSPTIDGYVGGLRDGDNYNSLWCLFMHDNCIPYMMGRPLGEICAECEKIEVQFDEEKLPDHTVNLRILWQMLLNLQLPHVETSKQLEGERYSHSTSEAETKVQIGNVNFAIGEVLIFFGDFKTRTGRLMGEEKGKTLADCLPGTMLVPVDTFHRGIAWFAMARRTGKRKYRSEAMKTKKQVAKWAKAGNPNIQHYHVLLDAEQSALDKKHAKADYKYKQAITHAARIGELHHAALFNERYADYLLNVRGHSEDGKYRMEQAIKYYDEWGAVGKAEYLASELEAL